MLVAYLLRTLSAYCAYKKSRVIDLVTWLSNWAY